MNDAGVRRMQILRTVVASGSVTAAATNLGYTPSAISQQVAALEKQAGIALFERAGRGIQPTAAGRLLSEYAAIIGRQVAEAEAALADLRAGRTGRLAVRYFATAGPTLMAPALARLRRKQLGVHVDLKMTDPDDPLGEVTQGSADLAIVVGPYRRPPEGIHLVHLLDDPYRAVLPEGHPLAAKQVLDLTDLADEPWVGSEWPGACREAVIDGCAAAGFSPSFVVETEHYATAQGFVAAGLGVSLIPELGLAYRHRDVIVRSVRNPEPVRAIYAAVRRASFGQPALDKLLAALRAVSKR